VKTADHRSVGSNSHLSSRFELPADSVTRMTDQRSCSILGIFRKRTKRVGSNNCLGWTDAIGLWRGFDRLTGGGQRGDMRLHEYSLLLLIRAERRRQFR
jgi:hypothetical protein